MELESNKERNESQELIFTQSRWVEDDRSYGDSREALVPAPEVVAFREMSHAQGYFISIMHLAHKRENRRYARETIRLLEFTGRFLPAVVHELLS